MPSFWIPEGSSIRLVDHRAGAARFGRTNPSRDRIGSADADIVEIDVSGRWALHGDGSGLGLALNGDSIADMSQAEVSTRTGVEVMTWRDALTSLLERGTRVVVEVKDPDQIEPLMDFLSGVDSDRYLIISFHAEVVRRAKQLGAREAGLLLPDLRRRPLTRLVRLLNPAWYAVKANADIVVAHRLVARWVRWLLPREVPLGIWTVNRQRAFDRLATQGRFRIVVTDQYPALERRLPPGA